MLTLKMVNKHYGNKHALKNLTFVFDQGVYTLLGSNGAGKTTLMNILAQVIFPDKKSKILCGDEDINRLNKKYREIIGYMPQHQGLFSSFTPRRFMGYMAALKGISQEEAKKQIPMLLKKVELYNEVNKKIGGFSGGMKQRLLIAQALLGSPKIIILDEPTAGLDPQHRVLIRELISDLAKEEDKIIIISTHIISDIESISREVLILNEGQLVASGSVEELISSLDNKASSLEQVYMAYCAKAGENA